MKTMFRTAMRVLVTLLFVVAGVSAQREVMQPLQSSQVVVPKVIGKELSEAKALLEKTGLTVARVIERETKLADGLVVNQRPEAGAQAAKGSGVILVVSKKGATPAVQPKATTDLPKKQVEIPNQTKTLPAKKSSSVIPAVEGKNMREAFQEIRRAGFTNIQPQRINRTEPRETATGVLADNAAVDHNREYDLDTAIILQISTGIAQAPSTDAAIKTPTREVVAKPPTKEVKPAIMPQGAVRVPDDIIGKNAVALASYLYKHDIAYVITKVKSDQKIGLIVALSRKGKPLSSGDIVQPGDEVNIDASAGPQYTASAGHAKVKLPDIETLELPDAIAKLRNKGLASTVEEVASDKPAGTVVGAESQGRPLKPGDTVSSSVSPVQISVSGGKNPQALPSAEAGGEKPEILDFSADKTQLTSLVNPENVTLKWTTKNAIKVLVQKRFKNANGQWQKEQVHTQTLTLGGSPTMSVQPGQVVCQVQGAAVFTLFAANKAGPSTRSISVTAEARPRIMYFGTGEGLPTPAVQPTLQEPTQNEMMIRPNKGPAAWEESYFEPAPSAEYTSTLVWQIADLGADGTAVIQPGIGSVAANSSRAVSVSSPTTYTLIARNSAGMDSAVCVVGIPKPTIPSFGSRPSSLAHVGETATLVWQTQNAERVTLTPPGQSVSAKGEYSTVLMEPTVFKLLAENNGATVEKECKVDVKDYQSGIYLFEVHPDQIDPGGSADLHIIALDLLEPGSIQITTYPEIPKLTDWCRSLTGQRNLDETFHIRPTNTTRFTATATTSNRKKSTQSATLEVGMMPQVAFFGTEDCHSVSGKMQCQLHWDVRNAKSVTIQPGFGVVNANDQALVDMSIPKLYILTAVGDPANRVKVDSVWTGDPAQLQARPQIHQFTATPTIATQGNPNVKLEWSGTGVKATLIKLRDGQEVKKWEDKLVIDSITDQIQNNVTYKLTMASLSLTTSKTADVEYQKIPGLTVSSQPTKVTIGEAATLTWQTENLGSTGEVLFQNSTQLAASGTKAVRPEITTTYEFLARNNAGETKRQVEIEAREPEYEIVYNSWPPNKVVREKKYAVDLMVERVDSLLFWETQPTGNKVLLHTETPARNPNQPTKVYWLYQPMLNKVSSSSKNVTLSMQVIQKGYPTKTRITNHEVLPSVDLIATPTFSYERETSGYLITVTLNVQNIGKDMWVASEVPNGKIVNVAVVFPPLINTYYYDPTPPTTDPSLTDFYNLLKPEDGVLGYLTDEYGYYITTATSIVDAITTGVPVTYSNVLLFELKSSEIPHINAGGNHVLTGKLLLPALKQGTYQIDTKTDADNFLDEYSESNNVFVTHVGASTDIIDLSGSGNMGALEDALCGITINVSGGESHDTGERNCTRTEYNLHFE